MEDSAKERAVRGISHRALDIGVAVAFLTVAAVVIIDALRIGVTWADDGPRAGYFPFYIGIVMAIASAVVLVQAIVSKLERKIAVEYQAMGQVGRLLVPTIVYVGLIMAIGIYVASMIYLAYFMRVLGKYKPLPIALVAILLPVALFFLFEVWFLVPLPKGPIEDWLGY